jgi:hypothetical protein
MKELLLLVVLLLNSPFAMASVPVDPEQPAVCPKEKSQTVRNQDAPVARSAVPATSNTRTRGGTLNGTRSATQRWNSFLPGMIR